MINLSAIIYEQVKPVIESMNEDGIYAISFLVYDKDDDVLQPTLTVGYNTERQFITSIPEAGNKGEARWNYAFWLQNELFEFGYQNGVDIIENWILENNLHHYPKEEEGELYDQNGRYIGKGPVLTQKFVDELIKVANMLHSNKVIETVFNHAIPIIIHELEYYEAIANETRLANPSGLADDFINWVMTP